MGKGPPQPSELAGPSFTDRQEAEEWARQNIRGLKHVDYSGADMDIVNALNRTVKTLSDRYHVDVPAIAPNTWEGWNERREAMMSAGREGIQFNPGECSGEKLEVTLWLWQEARYTSAANRDLTAIVAHEMAHVLHDRGRGHQGSLLSVEISRAVAREIVNRFRQRQGEAAIRRELGNTAWLGRDEVAVPAPSAWQETWAHAFSAYIREPKTLSRETVRMVEEVLRSLHLE